MLSVIAEAFDTAIEARIDIASKGLDGPLQGINDKINKLSEYLLKKEAAEGVNSAKTRFPDFDTYKEDIKAVLELYPGMAVEDDYVLDKHTKIGRKMGKGDSIGTKRGRPIPRRRSVYVFA